MEETLIMTRDTTHEIEDMPITIGPKTRVSLVTVIAIAGGLAWVGWVTSELNTIKSSTVSSMERYTQIYTEVKLLTARVETLERVGSVPLKEMKVGMDQLQRELEKHEAKDEERSQPRKQ